MHLFWIHAGVTAILGLLGWFLHRNDDLSSGKLLAIEAVVFGAPAFFFLVQGFINSISAAIYPMAKDLSATQLNLG